VLDGLHSKKGLSLFEISKLVGKSYMKVWGLCKALKIQTRSVAEADAHSAVKRSKHKRTSFDGNDEDKAYILGLTNGDLTALQVSGTAMMVSTSTTHPALASLFHDIFMQYGHVYQYPIYEIVKGYEWKLATRLDNSFQFLLKTPRQAIDWIAKNKLLFMSWLAGILDSDGGISIVNNNSYARISLCFYNTDLDLLRSIGEQLNEFSYHPVGPYLHREKGSVTPGWMSNTRKICGGYNWRELRSQRNCYRKCL
jgi:hypothetical protein